MSKKKSITKRTLKMVLAKNYKSIFHTLSFVILLGVVSLITPMSVPLSLVLLVVNYFLTPVTLQMSGLEDTFNEMLVSEQEKRG